MKEYIIAADVLSFIYMSIIFGSALRNPQRRRNISTKLFLGLVLVDLFAITVNAASYMIEGVVTNDTLLRLVNCLSYISGVALMSVFSFYMISVIREKTSASYRAVIPAIGILAVDLLFILCGAINGKLFSIIGHKYYAGPWDSGVYFLIFLCMLYLCFVLLKHCKELDILSLLGFGTYLVFPMILTLGVIFFHFPEFTYASSSIAIFIIYITIQSQTISEVMLREKIFKEVSLVDALTGLNNRRAFENYILKDDPASSKGVAFFDLNSLKYTNDTFGHAAGDRLIKSFADMLTEHFAGGAVFRISGDEFVVIKSGLSRSEMDSLMKSFTEKIYEKDRMAAAGYVYGESGELVRMIDKAEKQMYKDKALYYEETGKDRRI
ncbi:MAG: GGDEF domain-containing protein [Butyrivibrio sp.]|nr:GGDEF domain-containing protein [Butyrivibrio sp.]